MLAHALRRWKRETYRGGISDPFIIHWPAGIEAKGEVRTQYTHAIDMVPTVLELLGVEAPGSIDGVTQSPIEGTSFAQTLDNGAAQSQRHTQYFEMMGHRSIYQDGWRAVCPWPGPSFTEAGAFFGEPIPFDKLTELDAKGWELYHVDADFAENHNLADVNLGNVAGAMKAWLKEGRDVSEEVRAKLIEMIGTWYVEAGKYNVMPVDGRGTMRFAEERPQIAAEREHYTYYRGTQSVPFNAGPLLLNRSHSIIASVDVPEEGADGVLVSYGGVDGGYALYVQDGKLKYVQNYVSRDYLQVASEVSVPAGKHALRFEFEVTGEADLAHGIGTPGTGKLFIDDEQVGEADFPVTTPLSLGLTGGIMVGADPGAPVCPFYEGPFEYEGTIFKVVFSVGGEAVTDADAQLRMILARQ